MWREVRKICKTIPEWNAWSMHATTYRTPNNNQENVWPDGKTMVNCNRRYSHKYIYKWRFFLSFGFVDVTSNRLCFFPNRTHSNTRARIHTHIWQRCKVRSLYAPLFGQTVLQPLNLLSGHRLLSLLLLLLLQYSQSLTTIWCRLVWWFFVRSASTSRIDRSYVKQ